MTGLLGHLVNLLFGRRLGAEIEPPRFEPTPAQRELMAQRAADLRMKRALERMYTYEDMHGNR